MILLISALTKIGRLNRSVKFCSVGAKMNFGGQARISSRVLKAERTIQSTGRKKKMEINQSRM